jgi:transposase-like protein
MTGGTKKKLTKAAIKKYIEGGGLHCPYCGSGDMVILETESGEDGLKQDVVCHGCRRAWADWYTLTDVLEE